MHPAYRQSLSDAIRLHDQTAVFRFQTQGTPCAESGMHRRISCPAFVQHAAVQRFLENMPRQQIPPAVIFRAVAGDIAVRLRAVNAHVQGVHIQQFHAQRYKAVLLKTRYGIKMQKKSRHRATDDAGPAAESSICRFLRPSPSSRSPAPRMPRSPGARRVAVLCLRRQTAVHHVGHNLAQRA